MIIGRFRSQMANINVPKSASPAIYIRCKDPETGETFKQEASVFQSLLKCGDVNILSQTDAEPEKCLKDYVNEDFCIYIQVVGIIDISLEIKRVEKNIEAKTKLRDDLAKKMDKPDYAQKVP